jgi:hypothetical protein
MNTKQIEPLEIWTQSGNVSATLIAFTDFYDYHFDNNSGKVNYQLLTFIEDEGYDVVFSGTLSIPASIIQQWGTDDDVIYNYIIATLGLTSLNKK